MTVYKSIFDFSVNGDPETRLRAIKSAYDSLESAMHSTNPTFGDKIDREAIRSQAAVKELGEQIRKIPKDEHVKFTVDENGSASVERFNGKLKETEKQSKKTHSTLLATFGGTFIAGGLQTLGEKLIETTKSGIELAEQGEQTERVWKNLGVGDKGAESMSAQMVDLRAKTGYAAGDIKKMQTSFYGLTGSADSAQKLTTVLTGVGVASGLSGEKTAKLTRSLGRLFSADSVTASQLTRIETQAPKMAGALAQAAGVSQDSFNKMVAGGKLTGKEFEQLLEKVAVQSPAAFKSFGETGAGALARIEGGWMSAKSVFGTKLVETQKTGLTDLANFMSSKAFQGLMGDAANGLGNIAEKVAQVLNYIAKNKDSIADIATSTGTIVKYLVVGAWDSVTDFLHMVTGTKTSGIKGVADALKEIASHKEAIEDIGKVLLAVFVAEKINSAYKGLAGIAGLKSAGLIGDLVKLGGSNALSGFGKLGKSKMAIKIGTKLDESGLGRALKKLGSTGLGKLTKGLGKIAVPIAIAFDVAGDAKDLFKAFTKGSMKDKFKSVGESAGTLIGGGIGFVFGGPVGAAVGATIGKTVGKWAGSASKEFSDGWNKKGRGMKPPSGLIPKVGYYTRAAGDAVTGWTKSFVKSAGKHKKEILAALVNPAAGVAAWFLKDTKTGKAVAKWATGFAKNVKKMGFAKAVQQEVSKASDAFKESKMGKWWSNVSHSFDSWKKGFSKDWKNHWSDVSNKMGEYMDDARGHASDFGSRVSKWWGGWSGSFAKGWRNHWSDARNWMGDRLDDAHGTATSWGSGIMKWWGGFSSSFSKGWDSMWSGVSDFFRNIWKNIKGFAKDGINGIIDVINGGIGGIDKVIDFFGGKKNTIKQISKLAAGTRYHSGGPAIVNDEQGVADPRELIETPDGQPHMFSGSNVLLSDLPTGSRVYTAHETAQIAHNMGIPHFADGSDGDSNFFEQFIDKAANIGGDLEKKLKQIADYVAHPVESITKVFDQNAHFENSGVGDFGYDAGHHMIKAGADWFKGLFSKLKDGMNMSNPPGTGVARWRPIIEAAASALHFNISEGQIGKLLRQIQTESGGDPTVMQHGYTDANSGGNEARGLLQFAKSTWAADALPGHTDWKNGYNEILAAINVLNHGGEGGWGNVGNGHGWETGGHILSKDLAWLAEDGDEYVINPRKPNALTLIKQALKGTYAQQPTIKANMEQPRSAVNASYRAVQPVSAATSDDGSSVTALIATLVQNTQKLIDKDSDVYMDGQKVTKRVNKISKDDMSALGYQLGLD